MCTCEASVEWKECEQCGKWKEVRSGLECEAPRQKELVVRLGSGASDSHQVLGGEKERKSAAIDASRHTSASIMRASSVVEPTQFG
jgi:hypothetical protein